MHDNSKGNMTSDSGAKDASGADGLKAAKMSPLVDGAVKMLIGGLIAAGAEIVREKVVESRKKKKPEGMIERLKEKLESDGVSQPAHDDELRESGLKTPSRRSIHIMRWASLAFAVVMIATVAALIVGKNHSTSEKQKDLKAKVDKGPSLEVMAVKKAPPVHDLVLEAEARPKFQATVFAKVSGYLSDIRVIEGSQVKTGDILAVIDSPETDQAYASARADAYNKNRIAGRNRTLLRQRLISPQEAEQAFADARMATAKLRSAAEQKEYENLRAPFDGVITSRLVDPGALIPDASNAKTAQLAIVNLSDTSHLKIDAFIEQRYAAEIFAGMPVEIYLPDRASEKFQAVVARVSGVLDPRTRMLFIEMDFDNSAGRIVSGSFVSVALKVRRPDLLMAPVQALVSKANAPALATLGADNKIKLVPIQIFENDGSNVMIASGVSEGTKIVLDVGAELKDGDAIQPIFLDKKEAGGGPGGKAPQNLPGLATSIPAGGSNALSASAESGGTVSGASRSAQQEGGSTAQPAMARAMPPTSSTAAAPSDAPKKQKATGEKPAPLEKSSGGGGQKNQAGQTAKKQSSSGESQPKFERSKPSMSNSIYLPAEPPEPNE